MNYIGKFISNFKDFYNEINSATLTGAIDVIVIQQPDGTYLCSPFHVRFGKIGVLRSREKVVDIEVNGRPVNIHMKLGESGEAFFVEEVEDENEIPQLWATSPLPPVPDIGEELKKLKLSAEISADEKNSSESIDFAQSPTTQRSNISNDFNKNQNFIPSHNSALENHLNQQDIDKSQDCTVPQGQIIPSVDINDGNSKVKRRKRKKLIGKKHTKSKEVLNQNLSPSDSRESPEEDNADKPEDIFQMDDDYGESEEDEGYPSASQGLSRSISLPLNANKIISAEWPTRKLSSTFTGEFHPFSDGDVTPPSSPVTSRPASPKSDTEYETQKQETLFADSPGPSWGWGQLPNVPKSSQNISQGSSGIVVEDGNKTADNDGAEKRSMLGGMLSFMRSTKKIRHQPESEGLLLQSIESNSIDPEIASLYFPKYGSAGLTQKAAIPPLSKDEDSESGKGPSLPQSPHSVEGAIGGPCSSLDSDSEERQYLYGFSTDIAMSLCGGLLDADVELTDERFKTSLVTYDKFTENPSILLNPNLVIQLGGKYYNWQTASPMLTSIVMFQRALPEKTLNQLINEHMPKKKKAKAYSSWWSWRRSQTESKSDTPLDSNGQPASLDNKLTFNNEVEELSPLDEMFNKPSATSIQLQIESIKETDCDENLSDVQLPVSFENEPKDQEQIIQNSDTAQSLSNSENQVSISEISSPLINLTLINISDPVHIEPPIPEKKEESISIPITEPEIATTNGTALLEEAPPKKEKCKKSLRLTSDQIASLNLVKGANEVVFSVTTAYQGTTRCKCDIYLWKYDDKIVISDIDGTITKSDVLGHILPMVGRDWAQFGVAELFTKIHNNGYKFLYLSARAIGQARITRDYLRSLRQGAVCLPDGPLLLSPTSLISALHREVIEKKPEEFKISCLKDVQTLYPHLIGNPFYAGFGNKINDTWAYRAVGIPTTRVFTINSRGELRLELIQSFQSSYTRLSDQVDHIFPPQNCSREINGKPAPSFMATEEFSYFTYWKNPVTSVNDDEELPE